MKHLLSLALASVITLPALSQPVEKFPRLTGARLVDMLKGPSGAKNNLDLTAKQYADRRLAHSYISGVHDATEGSSWCSSKLFKPDTVDEIVVEGLRALPPAELAGNAAPLIEGILAKRMPCAKSSGA